MELRIKSQCDTSKLYRFFEFQLNENLVADFFPGQKKLFIFDVEKVYEKKCASLQSAISQVVKFHKKNF